MTTIKSYTDLSQSKKLAKILSLESADMCYLSEESLIPKVIYNGIAFFDSKEERPTNIIHCWSLAALLELLPKRIQIVDNVYELSVYLYGLYYWSITNGNLCFEAHNKDDLVDACYEAIVFLHEQKTFVIMKELSIEEKAKAYDRVVKEVKDFFEGRQKMYSDVEQTLEYLFPELKESEDEGICRKLIDFFKQCKAVYGDGFKQFGLNVDDAIVWLEKQGKPPRSTCTSLGTCKEYDTFVNYMKGE